MEDAAISSTIVDAGPAKTTATSEASIAASEVRVETPEKSVNVRAEKRQNQPRTSEMVNSAIVALNERGGSSIQAIKKYMAETYNVDIKKKALFIKKYLISAVDAGVLYRTRGSGAAGSFQVSKGRKFDTAKPKAKITAKPVVPKKEAAAKKSARVKKRAAVAEKSAGAAKKEVTVAQKQAAADKKLAEAMQKLAAANKKAAIDEKVAEAMKKLAAAAMKKTDETVAATVVSEKKYINNEPAADSAKSKSSELNSALPDIPAKKATSVAPNEAASTAAEQKKMASGETVVSKTK